MKRIFLLFALTVLTTNVFAENISVKDLQSYKEAAIIAIKSHRPAMVCENQKGSMTLYGQPVTAEGAVNVADSGEVFPGLQPLILFHYIQGSLSVITAVSTSADYKEVVSIRVGLSSTETHKENRGTLAKPNLVDVTTTNEDAVAFCK